MPVSHRPPSGDSLVSDGEPQDLMMLAARMVVQTQDRQSKMITDLNAELEVCRTTISNLERTGASLQR
ncbi:hypothetical protein HK405_014927, partial [Cladochytrium tenue]